MSNETKPGQPPTEPTEAEKEEWEKEEREIFASEVAGWASWTGNRQEEHGDLEQEDIALVDSRPREKDAVVLVVDGHNNQGAHDIAYNKFSELLSAMKPITDFADFEVKISQMFRDVSQAIKERSERGGAVATFVYTTPDGKIFIAQCGDAPVIAVSYDSQSKKYSARMLTPNRHGVKDADGAEQKRVEAAGGMLMHFGKYAGYVIEVTDARSLAQGIVKGLATTHSLGEAHLGDIISPEPACVEYDPKPEDIFLLAGSDGAFMMFERESSTTQYLAEIFQNLTPEEKLEYPREIAVLIYQKIWEKIWQLNHSYQFDNAVVAAIDLRELREWQKSLRAPQT